ncbi:MAG: chemotaxis response regulator protein-glutamate methylesterase [Dehalococcoidales bacterium]|nr:chemotaxis response regulator protein-glutamate methylesterase [Dehalococcoidales bacterium]
MAEKIKVLVVDDSAFARHVIARELLMDPDIQILGFARNGIEAVQKTFELKPDVITLDVEMPEMNGLLALKQIMNAQPTPVIMISSLTTEGAEVTMQSLEMGAVDYFLKESPSNPLGFYTGENSLNPKIKLAAKTRVFKPSVKPATPAGVKYNDHAAGLRIVPDVLVVIGCSTGGPKALYQVIPELPKDLPAAVLVVQHMPPGFTKSLAERLDSLSHLDVKEAENGDKLVTGQVYVAPGGYHMEINKGLFIVLTKNPPVCGVRPSVDVTMLSVAKTMGSYCVGVVMTGMGSDGTRGAAAIHTAGGKILAEDESTAVVWGMPRSVIETGNANRIAPVTDISSEIQMLVTERKSHDHVK